MSRREWLVRHPLLIVIYSLLCLIRFSGRGGFNAAIKNDKGLRHGVYVYNGVLTKRVIADRYGLVSRDIDLLIAAF